MEDKDAASASLLERVAALEAQSSRQASVAEEHTANLLAVAVQISDCDAVTRVEAMQTLVDFAAKKADSVDEDYRKLLKTLNVKFEALD